MPYIYSSCSNDNFFPVWKSHPRIGSYEQGVLVHGKANVQNKKTMETPRGVATQVSKEELELLKVDPHFQNFVKRGVMVVDEKATHGYGAETAGEKMEIDKGAQDTAKTYADMKRKPPKEDKEDD